MARILCIHPWIYDFAAHNVWIEPLGLLSIAAMLRQAGHQATLLDCLDRHHPAAPAPQSKRDAYGCGPFAKVEIAKPRALAHVPRRWGRYGLPVDVFEAELVAHPRPDAVLVTSMMTYWYPGPFEAIRRVKARWPDVPVALGGVYATLCPDHARAHSGADVVFTGPGESHVLHWIDRLAGANQSSASRTHPLPADIPPAHDLRRAQGYAAVLTARGCPFHCPYCAVHQLSPRRFTPRSPKHVVQEIAWCANTLGAQDIAFYDDALLFDAKNHIHPILDGILAQQLDVRFHTPNGLHARFIDLALARKMRQSGFVTIRLGLETADPAAQQRDGGKVSDAHLVRAVQSLRQAGFSQHEIAAYVLIARPDQDVASVRDTVSFAHQLGIPVIPAQYTPIPGTAEWEKAVQMGLLARDADPLLHNNSIYPCADMQTWEALKQEIRQGNRTIPQT